MINKIRRMALPQRSFPWGERSRAEDTLMLNLLGHKVADDLAWRPEQLIQSMGEPKTADDYYLWGLAHYDLVELSVAEQSFKRALELSFGHIPALYAMAQMTFEQGKIEEGKKWFIRTLKADAEAAHHGILFQRSLRTSRLSVETLASLKLWCLHKIEDHFPDQLSSKFEIGKLLFEISKFEASLPYFESVLVVPKLQREAAEYLSYVYETLYRGDELLSKTLAMCRLIEQKADIFFNLAMAFQHERRDLALHLFHCAVQEDPSDPGLRFSMEQMAAEIIAERRRGTSDREKIALIFAHLYQGAHGMAKKLFFDLKHLRYPEDFFPHIPEVLWKEHILTEDSSTSRFFESWRKAKSPTFLPDKKWVSEKKKGFMGS